MIFEESSWERGLFGDCLVSIIPHSLLEPKCAFPSQYTKFLEENLATMIL